MRWRFHDDERWTAAFSVARRLPVPAARTIRTADQWRVAGISAAIGIGVVVALLTTGLGDVLYGTGRTPSSAWRSILAGLGNLLALGGLLWALPRVYGLEKVTGLPRQDPVQWLTLRQRQVVDQQIAGGAPFDAFLLPLSYDRAGRLVNGPLPVLRFAFAPFLLASVTRGGDVTVVLTLWAVAIVVVALAVPQQRAMRAAAQRFVARHEAEVHG